MGTAVKPLPKGSNLIHLTHTDAKDKTWIVTAQIAERWDNDGENDILIGHEAELISALDEDGEPYLDFNDGLGQEFEAAALDKFYNRNQRNAYADPKTFAVEVTVDRMRYAAIASVKMVPVEQDPGAYYTHIEFPGGCYSGDGSRFDPMEWAVCEGIKSALNTAALNKYHSTN